MESVDLFGLVWKLKFLPATTPSGSYKLTVVLAGPCPDNAGVRWPVVRTGVFKFPTERGWEPRTYGASETLGLLGGVENRAQRLCSDALERNVGDLATLAIMELLEAHRRRLLKRARNGEVAALLLVQGPPLPKMVGRFGSLRYPSSLCIGWLTPARPFPWLTGIEEHVLATPSFTEGPEVAWEEESLVREHPIATDHGCYLLHHLNLYRHAETPAVLRQQAKTQKERPWLKDLPVPLSLQVPALLLGSGPALEQLPALEHDPLEFVRVLGQSGMIRDAEAAIERIRNQIGEAAKSRRLSNEEMDKVLGIISEFFSNGYESSDS